jgi:branched-chain amino acid transport system ATP-binding protein
VSLRIVERELCAIIGPNGAGKTTLFDVISGIRSPSAGTVALDGVDITRASASKRARLGLSRTYQRVQTFGWLSVEDNVRAALEWRGGGGGMAGDLLMLPGRTRRARERRDLARSALADCGLESVSAEMAGALPIGLARMVEIARAIVGRPKALLLDEPTSGLGELEAEHLAACLENLRRDSGTAVVLVEHDMSFVMTHSDRVIALNLGEVLATGSPREIQDNVLVQDAYLGEQL